MGRCQEFGPQIRDGCGHPMRPGDKACVCPECGVTCEGRYPGCPDVWARGPRTGPTAVITVDRPKVQLGLGPGTNGKTEPEPTPEPEPAEPEPPEALLRPQLGSGIGRAAGPPETEVRPGVDMPFVLRPERAFGRDPSTSGPIDVPDVTAPIERGIGLRSMPDVEFERPPRRAPAEPSERPGLDASDDEAPTPAGPSGPAERADQGPSGPTEREGLRPSGPTEREGLRPSGPTEREGLRPSGPTEREGLGPSGPTEREGLRPSGPTEREQQLRNGASVRDYEQVPEGSPLGPPAGAQADPRTHVLKWLEKKFDGLRQEVQLLASGANRQQDVLDELLERQAELEALVERQAEARDLRDRDADVREQREEFDAILTRQRQLTVLLEQQAQERPEPSTPDERGAELLHAAHDELAKLIGEVVKASESSAAAQRENTDRVRLLQTALTKQLRALTAAVVDSEGRSHDQVAALGRRLDALAQRLPAPKKPAPAEAAANKSPDGRAPAKKATSRSTTANRASSTTKRASTAAQTTRSRTARH